MHFSANLSQHIDCTELRKNSEHIMAQARTGQNYSISVKYAPSLTVLFVALMDSITVTKLKVFTFLSSIEAY